MWGDRIWSASQKVFISHISLDFWKAPLDWKLSTFWREDRFFSLTSAGLRGVWFMSYQWRVKKCNQWDARYSHVDQFLSWSENGVTRGSGERSRGRFGTEWLSREMRHPKSPCDLPGHGIPGWFVKLNARFASSNPFNGLIQTPATLLFIASLYLNGLLSEYLYSDWCHQIVANIFKYFLFPIIYLFFIHDGNEIFFFMKNFKRWNQSIQKWSLLSEYLSCIDNDGVIF